MARRNSPFSIATCKTKNRNAYQLKKNIRMSGIKVNRTLKFKLVKGVVGFGVVAN